MFFLSKLFGSDDDEVGGCEDVVAALIESRSGENEIGVFGEPRLVEKGQFVTEHEIEVPVKANVPVSPLRFELDGDRVNGFLDKFGLTVDTFGEVEGEQVQIEYTGESYYAQW